MDCRECFEKLQDFLDRELNAEEALLVEAHLRECGCCADEYRFEESVLRRIRECMCAEVPPELRKRCLENLSD